MRKSRERCEKLPVRVLQAAAVSKGFQGKELVDMDALYEAGVRGFTDDGLPLMDEDIVVRKAMEKAKELDVPISLHEEDPAYIKQPGGQSGKGFPEQLGYGRRVISGGSRYGEERLPAGAGDRSIGGYPAYQLRPGSGVCKRGRRKKALNVTAEASPHHFTLTEEAVLKYGTLARMNPPLRTEEDRMRIIKGLQEGTTIEVIATDHAPHSKEEKEKSLAEAPSGITGLETALWSWHYRAGG